MRFFYFALVLFIFSINFEIASIILNRSLKNFEKTKEKGKAKVIGYNAGEQLRWYSLMVKVLDLNDDKTYIVNSAKINIHDYPKGSIIDVVYAKTKVFGKEMYSVYLLDRMPPASSNISNFFKVMAFIALVATIFFCIVGVYSILT